MNAYHVFISSANGRLLIDCHVLAMCWADALSAAARKLGKEDRESPEPVQARVDRAYGPIVLMER